MTLVQVAKVVQLGKVLTVLGCLLWGNLISNASPPPVQIKPQIISLEVVRVEVQCAAAPLLRYLETQICYRLCSSPQPTWTTLFLIQFGGERGTEGTFSCSKFKITRGETQGGRELG